MSERKAVGSEVKKKFVAVYGFEAGVIVVDERFGRRRCEPAGDLM